jgi:hypothetical protein
LAIEDRQPSPTLFIPWSLPTIVVAPLAGSLAAKYGNQQFMAAGMAIQTVALAWFVAVAHANTHIAGQSDEPTRGWWVVGRAQASGARHSGAPRTWSPTQADTSMITGRHRRA